MPAPCSWSVLADDAVQVVFHCATCGRDIGFVHPAYGSPNPVSDGSGSWVPPDDVLKYLDPCP